MVMRFAGPVGLWLALMGGASQATVIELDCRVGERSNKYFQPERIQLSLDTDTGKALIRDDLTAKVKDGPAYGKIETFNDIRLTVYWRVGNVPRDPKLSYSPTTANELTQRLTVRAGGDATLVSHTAGQYLDNLREFRTKATCKVLN
ncbi:MAG: hypothetical protein IH625_11195 [Rhodobacteraceae bacterium]|nr:hypothetical protein [Paracoccaceae bacterium]